jgi:uncharacterized protein
LLRSSKRQLNRCDRRTTVVVAATSCLFAIGLTAGCSVKKAETLQGDKPTATAKSEAQPSTEVKSPPAKSAPKAQAPTPVKKQAATPQKKRKPEEIPCNNDKECPEYYRCFRHQCTVPPGINGDVSPNTPRITFKKNGKDAASFYIEIAQEFDTQRRGLMYRRKLHPEWGMLFAYSAEFARAYWMKNTLIPLDMVFMDKTGKVIGILEGVEPLTRRKRGIEEPSRFMLELNAGTAKKKGIQKGMTIQLDQVDPRLQPTPSP